MQHDDDSLQRHVRRAWPDPGRVPTFASVWAGAERRRVSSRRRNALAAAAVLAIAVLFLGDGGPEPGGYIEVAELMESTYWVAPSDVLLPDREFDIYEELPVLFESTEPAEGALL